MIDDMAVYIANLGKYNGATRSQLKRLGINFDIED